MFYYIEVQIEALLELREAYDWYQEQRDGLGDELLEEIEFYYQKALNTSLLSTIYIAVLKRTVSPLF